MSETRFADVEIRIFDERAGRYPVDVTVNHEQEFPRGHLSTDLPPWVPGTSPEEDGRRLFDWLFADEALKTAWAEVRGRYPQRRIRLRIDAAAPKLHEVPWELLRDTGGEVAHNLAATSATPFSRYLAGTWRPGSPILKRPIKVLVAIANPAGLSEQGLATIEPEREWASLQAATEGVDVELTRLPEPCTLGAIEAELRQGYHVLHLVAHGAYSERQEHAALFLADDANQLAKVRDSEFAEMLARRLQDADLARDDQLRLVFLGSCETATTSPADAFRGLAPKLVQAGVPAVLAMQDLVPMETARAFASTFYERLLAEGQVDLAANEARASLLTAKRPGAEIPVLFMRLENGQLLATDVGDAAATIETEHFEPETVYVPAGSFLMGRAPGDGVPEYETPEHEVVLPAYRIGRYPVTNEQYAYFVRDMNHPVTPEAGWNGQRPPDDELHHPMNGVTWYDAVAYCEWLSETTGRQYTLPTEAEWEKAARGTEGRLYPWGNEWDPDRCHHDSQTVVSVETYPPQSVYGCYDLVGNAREWTRSLWGEKRRRPDPRFAYPWADDGRNDLDANGQIRRVYRGGAAADRRERLTSTSRHAYAPDKPGPPHKRHGFRVVMHIEPEK